MGLKPGLVFTCYDGCKITSPFLEEWGFFFFCLFNSQKDETLS